MKDVLRIAVMIVSLLCFLGFCYWAYSRRSKAGFDEAAQLPLADDDLPASPADRKE
ncbi:MAG: cbb3-type cytochrome c oxidase subunit 3 [Azoarcus sp.]|jgi:cytochrome c oxidase cbb3-type subunit 4|nr:cbb3-type cytochrome c oxidase subunit 3 [Azoarcus sp.]